MGMDDTGVLEGICDGDDEEGASVIRVVGKCVLGAADVGKIVVGAIDDGLTVGGIDGAGVGPSHRAYLGQQSSTSLHRSLSFVRHTQPDRDISAKTPPAAVMASHKLH